jgi:hypothetical protein
MYARASWDKHLRLLPLSRLRLGVMCVHPSWGWRAICIWLSAEIVPNSGDAGYALGFHTTLVIKAIYYFDDGNKL